VGLGAMSELGLRKGSRLLLKVMSVTTRAAARVAGLRRDWGCDVNEPRREWGCEREQASAAAQSDERDDSRGLRREWGLEAGAAAHVMAGAATRFRSG
jgi:hypothetical protein